MAISGLWIENGCTSCGLCESMCPEVFEMPDEAIVKKGTNLVANKDCIKEAAQRCPVEVIHFEES